MKKCEWLTRLRDTTIPQHKLQPAKWLAFLALLLLLVQLTVEALLLSE